MGGINLIFSNLSFCQRVICEGECAHPHVRCAGIRVHANYEKCVRCACMPLIFRHATVTKVTSGENCHNTYIRCGIWDRTFAHFLEQNSKKMPFFVLKTILECPYPVLEHLFLLWYVLSCFRTSYSVSEQQKNVEEMLKKIWTCEVHACDPKNS